MAKLHIILASLLIGLLLPGGGAMAAAMSSAGDTAMATAMADAGMADHQVPCKSDCCGDHDSMSCKGLCASACTLAWASLPAPFTIMPGQSSTAPLPQASGPARAHTPPKLSKPPAR